MKDDRITAVLEELLFKLMPDSSGKERAIKAVVDNRRLLLASLASKDEIIRLLKNKVVLLENNLKQQRF